MMAGKSLIEMLGEIFSDSLDANEDLKERFTPERIMKSGKKTTVLWADGSTTTVKLQDGDEPDDYDAFTAALAKKIFGSNSKLKKVIDKTKASEPVVLSRLTVEFSDGNGARICGDNTFVLKTLEEMYAEKLNAMRGEEDAAIPTPTESVSGN